MRWQGREQSSNIEDRRGSGGGGGGGMGIIGIIVVLVGAYYGVDLSGLVGGAQQLSGGAQQTGVESKQDRRHTHRLRYGSGGDGAVLLPGR